MKYFDGPYILHTLFHCKTYTSCWF